MGDAPGDAIHPEDPPLLTSRLRRPAPTPGALVRQRLLDQLTTGDGARVALVVAPAGYGKSTLLAQWAETVDDSGLVAWVNVDPWDNDPLVLWSRVVTALQKVCPDLDLTISMGSVGKGFPAGPRRCASWTSWTRRTHWSWCSTTSIGSPVGRCVRAWPGSWRRPRQRATGPWQPTATAADQLDAGTREVAEVRSEQLSFTPTEADWLLNQRFGLGLDPKDVVTLVTRTQGWPAGLQLAAMSMANTPDRHRFVTDFGASHRRVQDYLVEEVLDSDSEELRSLMVRSSILERVCGPVVDAVLDQSGSGRHRTSWPAPTCS